MSFAKLFVTIPRTPANLQPTLRWGFLCMPYHNFRIIGLLFMLASLATPAMALLPLGEFQSMRKKSKSMAVAYVSGVGAAIGVANAFANADLNTPLYCPPSNLSLNYDQFVQLIENETQTHKLNNDISIEIILMSALQREFPCRRATNEYDSKNSQMKITKDLLADPSFIEKVARTNGMTPSRFYNQAPASQSKMIQDYLAKYSSTSKP